MTKQDRQQFIADTLKEQGYINRSDLAMKFGVSMSQASIDLNLYQAANPGAMEYNVGTRRYEVKDG